MGTANDPQNTPVIASIQVGDVSEITELESGRAGIRALFSLALPTLATWPPKAERRSPSLSASAPGEQGCATTAA